MHLHASHVTVTLYYCLTQHFSLLSLSLFIPPSLLCSFTSFLAVKEKQQVKANYSLTILYPHF